jgi:fibrillarin-like pre-rRNA processing protein
MMAQVREAKFCGTFTDGSRLLTRNLDMGRKVYGEDLVFDSGSEYRVWDPRRSKLAAALMNGLSTFPFRASSRVLYLGAASGTTASHVSDICLDGMVSCVEVASRPFRDLIALCERRKNMAPILADAGKPAMYASLAQPVDIIYQDISQRDQVELLVRNIEAMPPASGTAFLMVKARSIDVSANPTKIFAKVERELLSRGFEVPERIDLAPYERDHMAMVVRTTS